MKKNKKNSNKDIKMKNSNTPITSDFEKNSNILKKFPKSRGNSNFETISNILKKIPKSNIKFFIMLYNKRIKNEKEKQKRIERRNLLRDSEPHAWIIKNIDPLNCDFANFYNEQHEHPLLLNEHKYQRFEPEKEHLIDFLLELQEINEKDD